MIKWINDFFDITNDISVPILISLIVFIVGGLTSTCFKWIVKRANEIRSRKMLLALIDEVVKDLNNKETNTEKFYQEIRTDYNGNWSLSHKPISYLETFFELDFIQVYSSFANKKNMTQRVFTTSDKSFHEAWEALRGLRFIEDRLENDLNKMMEGFNKFHKEYRIGLDRYYKYYDESSISMNGVKKTAENEEDIDYLIKQDNIWRDWQKLDPDSRTAYHITYNEIILRMMDLNREYPNSKFAQKSDHDILHCLHQFEEIKNVLMVYRAKFKGFHEQYQKSKNILETSSANMK